jgi:mannose/cellobiose epimerase-like protein (N-acyl-D-glucosamine 2-epimerase family)
MRDAKFSFSDTLAGYVIEFDREKDTYSLRTVDDQVFQVKLRAGTSAQLLRNLGDPYLDCKPQMRDMLVPGRYLFTYGIFYPQGDTHVCEAERLIFLSRKPDRYFFEKREWWIRQLRSIADFYLRAEFGTGPVDYRNYRTDIKLSGEKAADNYRQETDTVSRMIYGLATAYLLTGEDRYLEGAEKGTEYLRKYMRFYDPDEGIVYWYHGIYVHGDLKEQIFASEFGDDFHAIPAYEQIYALAGPVQTYRITGDPRILRDAEMTVELFDRHFRDLERGGYFSHLDPVTLDPRDPSLGHNRAKKNWNSVGDHAPAYLINLWLATGAERYATMLEETFDTIVAHFPEYDRSPFVQERFLEDWSPDRTHLWQQDRGVVGHNHKIAWNLMRMYSLKPKNEYANLACKIALVMPAVASDRQRGGWYDVMERMRVPGEDAYRFAFHDRKAWWQQEQAILAYYILAGVLDDKDYLEHARRAAAFYNAFFLDHDDGAVFFNVLASGIPYLVGTERFKGSHSMSCYHSTELCYLAQVYMNLLLFRHPLMLHFKPLPRGFKNNLLRVAPDILPPGRIHIGEAWINDVPYTDFDAAGLVVRLPDSPDQLRVRVRIDVN